MKRILTAIALLSSGLIGAEVHAETVELMEVPPAVRATIEREAKGHAVTELEKETENGMTVYEAEWRETDKKVELKVDEQGKVIERKHEAIRQR